MAIQNRRGIYSDFDPTKMVEGEFAVVQSGDPNTTDGKAVYIAPTTGTAERVALYKDVHQDVVATITDATDEIVQDITDGLEEDVTRAETAATNAEASAEEAQEILENKADIDGYYPSLYAGNLASTRKQTDTAPYLMRKTGGDLSRVGEREDDTLVGGTVAVNQLARPISSAITVNGVTLTPNSDGSITMNGTASSSGFLGGYELVLPTIDHVYALIGNGGVISGQFFTFIGGSNSFNSTIKKAQNATGTTGIRSVNGTVYSNNKVWLIIIDLTQMFGSTIADYLYNLESATAGAGIAKLKEWGFLTGEYIPYNAGTLESVEATAHKMVGFNQWDEEWELGSIGNDGSKVASTTRIRSKNYIPVVGGATYYIKVPSITTDETLRIALYDANHDFISMATKLWNGLIDWTLTVPNNCCYILFRMPGNYGTTYNHDICINLSSDRNGEYEAYHEQTYDYGSDTLNGIFKLDASNNLYADGDVKTSDGVITRKYNTLIINGDTDVLTGASGLPFRVSLPDASVPTSTSDMPNAIADKLQIITQSSTWGTPFTLSLATNHNIYFKLSDSITTIEDAKTYLASNPITLVYELATPTTEQSTPFPSPQVCYPDGTEEFVTENGVPVGHETEYPYDLKGLTEGLIDVPDVPSSNGTYVLKATRSASGISYEWVSYT